MLRRLHNADGQCSSDMQRANNTAAKLVVVIAAAVVANAESYSKSFSAQGPTAEAETTVWYVRTVVSQSCSKPSEHMVSHKGGKLWLSTAVNVNKQYRSLLHHGTRILIVSKQ